MCRKARASGHMPPTGPQRDAAVCRQVWARNPTAADSSFRHLNQPRGALLRSDRAAGGFLHERWLSKELAPECVAHLTLLPCQQELYARLPSAPYDAHIQPEGHRLPKVSVRTASGLSLIHI